MTDPSRFNEIFEALADPYRRQLLLSLIKSNPQDDDDPDPLNIHPEADEEPWELNIYMGHLPMLDGMGIIEWDEEGNEIIKGPDWAEFEPLLRLIAENKHKLPEEWFGETEVE